MNNKKRRSVIITLVISVIVALVIILYAALFAFIPFLPFRIIAGVAGAGFTGCMIYICIRRIQEIKGEDTDDIGKY